jgi:hypothetical protein
VASRSLLDWGFAGKSAEGFLETFLELARIGTRHRRAGRDDEVETGRYLVLMAAEKLAHRAFATVAHHCTTNSPRRCDTQPSGPVVVSFADPKQEPAPIDPAPVFAGNGKLGAAVHPPRRSETEAALRGFRQR